MKLSRRGFLVGALIIAAGATPLFRRYFARIESHVDETLRLLCDRILPGHASAPSAVSLGIDREIRSIFELTRRGRLRLLALVAALDHADFFAADPDDQASAIRAYLAEAAEDGFSPAATAIQTIYVECVRRYYTNPAAWGALGYRIPQPHGYPDYEECATA